MTDERKANEIDRRLGARMQARRLEIGMTQERLAQLIAVTPESLRAMENGAARISTLHLVEASSALDLPITNFFAALRVQGEADAR